MTTRHRCEQWKDERILPQSDWLWGTCMMHYPGKVEAKTEWLRKDQWTILDEKSATLSLWARPECPFCGVQLSSLLT